MIVYMHICMKSRTFVSVYIQLYAFIRLHSKTQCDNIFAGVREHEERVLDFAKINRRYPSSTCGTSEVHL